MKKFYFFAIAALGMMAGCQKPDVNPTVVDDSTPVAVTFGLNAPVASVSTKAAIEDWTGNENLVVYGFPRTATDFSAPNQTFIDGATVTSPVLAEDGPETQYDVVPQKDGKSYFYASDNTTYDFYGYYTGSADVDDVYKSADTVRVHFTIDGSNDLMLAKADQTKDVVGHDVLPERAYSAYSARREVKPVLTFEHQLARFTFKVVAGTDKALAGAETAVAVEEISILETAAEGDLIVVGAEGVKRGITKVGEKDQTLTLADVPAEGVSPTSRTEGVAVGESIMVIPGETTYKLQYVLSQANVDQTVTSTVDLKINKFGAEAVKDEKFLAGKQYEVTLTVYSLEEVVITAKVAEWVDGGDYIYDPDLEWGIPETAVALVTDKATFETIPAAYRQKHQWDENTAETLPWLAAWFTHVAVDTEVKVTVNAPDGTALSFAGVQTWPTYVPESVTENSFKVTLPYGTSLITLDRAELGLPTDQPLPAGDWTVTVATTAETPATLATGTVTVVAPAEEE